MKKFSREGDTPSPDPPTYGASIFAPMALKLNVTPPEKKILVTVLHGGCHIEFRNINGLGEDFQQI